MKFLTFRNIPKDSNFNFIWLKILITILMSLLLSQWDTLKDFKIIIMIIIIIIIIIIIEALVIIW